MFDRDFEETKQKQTRGNVLFDQSIKTAQSNGIKLAWSNDAFELWILLHFEDLDFNDPENKKRQRYYDRLTDVYKALLNPNDDLLKVLNYPNLTYKGSLKSHKNFRNIVRVEIVKNTKVAIKRAKILESKNANLHIQDHEKSPFTLVHNLVEELIKYGGKELV